MLLFIGVFSTPTRLPVPKRQLVLSRILAEQPPGNQSVPAQGSVTPLLKADVQSNNIDPDQLSPADIRGTSRRSSESDEITGQTRSPTPMWQRPPSAPPREQPEPVNPFPADGSDPLAATGSIRAQVRRHTVMAARKDCPSARNRQKTYSYGGGGVGV